MDSIFALGVPVVEIVLKIAGFLKSDGAPGIVAFVLVLAMLIVGALFWMRTNKQIRAIKSLRRLLSDIGTGRDFAEHFNEIEARLNAAGKTRGKAISAVATAWSEYAETVIVETDPDGRPVAVRNSVRPSAFFNGEDIGFGPGWYRIAPNLFVSFGLFLTFLGLVAALQVASSGTIDDRSIQELLAVASAKFIMSLTGLLCSILLTIFLKIRSGAVQHDLHDLARAIEDRMSFISLEEVALQQLRASSEMKENFRQIGFELVAELARPLREELPGHIGRAINDGLAPILNQIQSQSTSNVRDMAVELSSQISGEVGNALTQASRHLSEAAGRIEQLADRLDGSSRAMGDEMQTAIGVVAQALNDLRQTMNNSANETSAAFSKGAEELQRRMTETLGAIERNTREGASAMSEAALQMGKAAETFRAELQGAVEAGAQAARSQLDAAGQGAAEQIRAAGSDILKLAEEGRDQILRPLEEMRDALAGLVARIGEGAVGMERVSTELGRGAETVSQASQRFAGASDHLVAASAPITRGIERLERATGALESSTQAVATTMQEAGRQNIEIARQTLEQAVAVLGDKRRAIADSLQNVKEAVAILKGQGERFDELDVKLGAAFEAYTEAVQKSLDTIRGHVESMQNGFAEAVDTLRTVISEAEEFLPQQEAAE